MRACLVSRELYPYVGGGIAPSVAGTAKVLHDGGHDVVVVTTSAVQDKHEELTAAGDERLLPPGVTVLFAEEPEPDGYGGAFTHMHAYSANVHEVLRAHYGERGPDLIEFPDYLGEGFVTIQARHTAAPWLRDTTICVRLHTTSEMCAVLDGRLADDFQTKALLEMERYALKHADRVLWCGGDIYATYQRFYGEAEVAPGARVRDGWLHDTAVPEDDEREPLADGERPLRLLYVGRMERRKGVQNLLRALDRLGDRWDWRLTLLGGDTQTGPTSTSLKDNLLLATERDQRVEFAEPVPYHEVPSLIRHHDVVVVPSLWECWPNVGREALMLGRPLLVTPVGGLVDMAQPGRSGWVAKGADVGDLVVALQDLLADRAGVDALIAGGGARARFEELVDNDQVRASYEQLAGVAPQRPRPSRAPGDRRVSVIVPYFKLEEHLEETLRSIEAQTHDDVETIVVNDGSLRDPQDAFLHDLAQEGRIKLLTQPNSGLGPARNAGIGAATGSYVLPLDADDLIDPAFVERCLEALDADRSLAYVTTWVQYMDEEGVPFGGQLDGYLPFGNWSRLIHTNNVAGTCSAVFRRRVFERGLAYSPDLVSYEDWLLYWQMHDQGLYGAVIPERLFHYRVRRQSMTRRDGAGLVAVLHEELRALARERLTCWTTPAPMPR